MFNSQLQFPKTAISDGTSVIGVQGSPLRVDPTGDTPQPVFFVDGPGGNEFATAQVDVTATATLIVTPAADSQGVLITNLGTTDVWIGDATVTTTTGQLLPGVRGANIVIPTSSPVYGRTASGTQRVSYVEIG